MGIGDWGLVDHVLAVGLGGCLACDGADACGVAVNGLEADESA